MADGLSWPPGWFRDPTGRHDHRWWDGAAWTDHVADAGVASTDVLPAAEGPAGAQPVAPLAPLASAGTAASSDPVAVWALVVGIVAIVASLVPFFGLVPPVVAIVLAIIGRRRIRTSGRRGDGLAIGGLLTGITALLIALVISAFAVVLLAGSGGSLVEAFADYLACLEVRSSAECQMLLERSLTDIFG